jgi:hypothetical protein
MSESAVDAYGIFRVEQGNLYLILAENFAMKHTERGQSLVLVALGLVALALLIMAVTGNLPGMKKGADAIGESVANSLENTSEPEIDLGTVMSAWVNNQRIYPNKHAVDRHDVDAVTATNCYNDHGVFYIQANRSNDWYFHCLEEDRQTVRTTIWKRDGNIFHMESAYTKGDGAWSWAKIKSFFENKWGATRATFPPDGVLYIDGQPAPYIGQ